MPFRDKIRSFGMGLVEEEEDFGAASLAEVSGGEGSAN